MIIADLSLQSAKEVKILVTPEKSDGWGTVTVDGGMVWCHISGTADQLQNLAMVLLQLVADIRRLED